MSNIKLSFIVPVYNVEKYLRKCVLSLVHQDYSDYEIILVDDGSTDNSGVICDDFTSNLLNANHSSLNANSNVPIRVIHQENAGLSAARNTGIKAARGTYLCFVDSDDYWEPNVLSELMAQIDRDNLDVLRFKYQNVNEFGEVFIPYKRDHRLDNDYSPEPTDGVSFLNICMNTQCYAVMFIVRSELLSDCRFTEGIYFEDTDWTPRLLCKVKRVASTDTIVYNYLVRDGSITNAINRDRQKKVLDDKIRLIGELQRQAMDLEQKGLSNAWFGKMIAATVVSIIEKLATEFYDEKKNYMEQLSSLNVYPIYIKSFKGRLVNLCPRLAIELLHIKNRN